jgi:hypothetical protein
MKDYSPLIINALVTFTYKKGALLKSDIDITKAAVLPGMSCTSEL